jgi:hypothetical protein
VSDSFNKEAAQRLLRLKADAEVQARVAELADRCNEGTLTSDEKAEYESLITSDSVIGVLKARARYLLSKKRK